MNRFRVTVAAVALSAGFASGMAACASGSSNAATVNGAKITKAELEDELRAIASNDSFLKVVEAETPVRGTRKGTFDVAFTAQVLTRQIAFELISSEVDRRKLVISEADRTAARATAAKQVQGEEILNGFPPAYQSRLVERSAEVNALSAALLGAGSPDAAALAYYTAHQDQFQRACVSVISAESEEKANEIKTRLDAGEDFAAIARAESKDSLSAPRGGDQGCGITPDNQLSKEYSQAVFSQPVGVAGPPIKTPFGILIVKVTSRTTPPYEEVAALAREKAAAAGEQPLEAWYHEAVDKAKITVNPEYGRFERRGTNMVVVPPQAPTTTATAPPQDQPSPFSGGPAGDQPGG